MPKKQSVMLTAQRFVQTTEDLDTYCKAVKASEFSEAQISLAYEGATIKLYSAFEDMVLGALVGAINNDTQILSETTGIEFPTHITDDVCEYIITGTSYFDFRGRSGLIREVRRYVPKDHYLHIAVKKPTYSEALDRLVALRNYAAHGSGVSKRAALKAVGQTKIGTAGSWIKRQDRFTSISNSLAKLAKEIETGAPY